MSRSARRTAAGTSAPLDDEARPRLAPAVTFEKTDEGRWIAMLHGVPSSRVSGGVVALLSSMDGETTLRDLHLRFAASDPRPTFLALIERFRHSGLLDDAHRTPPGRVSFRPPFTVQFATMRAPAIFARLSARAAAPSLTRLALPLGILLCAGLLAAAVQAHDIRQVLTSPLPLTELMILVAVLASLTLLHECAHGITLTRFGGSPRRAGFMLIYLAPAFFVDVTDGWRLGERRQRVAVALAGPAVHGAVGAAGALAALATPAAEADRILLLLAFSCAGIVVVNLIPFVRFDGYLALMSALDEPNLRDRAMHDARHALARMLFGGPRAERRLGRWWSVPFGLASIIAPVALVLVAVARIADALAGGGPVWGLVTVALGATVASVGIAIVVRGLGRVLRAGVSPLRFGLVTAALTAAVATAGAVIPVPLSATYGFVAERGRVVLVQAREAPRAGIPAGSPVALTTNGILVHEQIGAGTATPREPRSIEAPVDALLPVLAGDAMTEAVIVAEVEVDVADRGAVVSGRARVDLGTRSLWQAVWARGVQAPLSPLLSDK
ncbi:daptide biosynthesis intramembrane metalloprotease [Microbacterium hydrocarbonoxydans]|uniref:daptide biosynthesis intramembrane metalloprotease n=1 Tax=Microbacterium hydrocarbonoxydans TaxID=273678 RepID=UPI00203EFE7C|nr:daptide biosynthesis intramembrane metalloprotease [Microbacterium hydrocarbonoxydans]MCM3779985.1 hypothetical protein [Microbacterium hydrocarbonoxydans]